ncbi:MAG: HAD family acid phosphatase [Rudaea sp.]|nr:HAD family acid phosphatase [Rudaea sp.]
MHRLSLAIAILLLGACASAPQTPPAIYAGASTNAKFPADDRLNATLWMQASIEHDLVFREVYHAAQAKLLEALADPSWDALPKGERTNDAAALPPAVIVDVDETVLDNTPFEARMIRDNSAFNDAAWTAWVDQKSAHALPGALDFAKFAAAHGVTIFYLTNRAEIMAGATRDNLQAQGFPLGNGEETVLAKGANTPGCIAQGGNKGCRRKLVAQRHRVLQMFGDQLGDFLDGADTDASARATLVQPYQTWFGERWFALPNPDYGSWESAITQHPADAKQRTDARAAKHAALREN